MKMKHFMLGGAVVGGLLATRMLNKQKRFLELPNRVVLITGGTRGLGLVMARRLAKKGAKVAICGRDQDSIDGASEQLGKLTADFLCIKCDVTSKSEVKEMVEQIREHWGEVEVLINNAGIIQVGPIENMQEEDYQRSLEVHFWGAYNLIQEVLPAMKTAGSGRIVNIASINAKVSFPHLLPYTVGKYALSGFSEGITSELANYGIRVTSVYPGLMRTGSPRNIDVKARHKKEYAWFKVSDSLPVLSMSAEKAASEIIKSMQYGSKILNLGWPTKIATFIEGIAPGLNIRIFELANKFLPDPVVSDYSEQKGYESESEITNSAFTRKTEIAEEKNNQV